jgi:hypothetical protein
MRLDEQVVSFITSYHRAGGVIGSICSGAQLLISAGLCKGRVISAYKAMAIDVENAGGTWHAGPVVNFDRIVSSPHYRNLPEFMKELLQAVDSEKAWRNQVTHVSPDPVSNLQPKGESLFQEALCLSRGVQPSHCSFGREEGSWGHCFER